MSIKLAIMEIERFAIHDGPGIRSTVFLQGCSLRCPWCANPESQTIGSKLMYYEKKCIRCGRCAAICPKKAILLEESTLKIQREKCISCKKCEAVCLQDAMVFSGKEFTVDDILSVILRDRDYYEESGGGVTISGGECFVQFQGLMELLKKLKQEKLHVAVETCGQTNLEYIKEAFPYIDLFLFDLKHMDAEIFHKVTGGDLEQILENITYIAKKDSGKIIIRVPVIPGFNYKEKFIKNIFSFVKKTGITKVNLLPYHTFGINKYKQLGRNYPMKYMQSLKKEELGIYRDYGETMGICVSVEG